ncbi:MULTISPECIES: hypothetical protein [Hyphomicrobium]|uniref:Uncharacterized protein n=1 Tax=Hyphomicrobium facile TaxID=51670 RepID=A0A1I7NT86_9HYPH|nr:MULTISPECIES: hypothetical protein [Hyphomicrobium]MBY0560744.1 hypothetical protein [Hyphomicrobium sp.]CAA2143415.1 hypothetical protein HYPP_04229 [Hyphomicrobium sp. ghe19]SFV37808.1 hypothetical protein SAMN04488557_3349 [Hyphomicrobium facile]
MRTYLISYDLAQPNRNQHVLAQVIMGLGDKWARPLSNTWYVTSDREEFELETELKELLAEEDGLVIQATKREAVMTNTSLRWFRQRRPGLDLAPDGNVIAFPLPAVAAAEPMEPELPFARAG